MSHPNLELLEIAAAKLRPLLPEIVFVGGCATGLLITDPGAAAMRRTYDVDVISEITSYAEYAAFSDRLRLLGFNEDNREGAPLCRWQHGELVLDVMPLDASILGFSNRWYPDALHAAVEVELIAGLTIRAITAPYFLATKIEAFRGRGDGDYFASHDLEDFIAVIDGRPSLMGEVEASSQELRAFLAASRFHDALPGILKVTPQAKRALSRSRRSSKHSARSVEASVSLLKRDALKRILAQNTKGNFLSVFNPLCGFLCVLFRTFECAMSSRKRLKMLDISTAKPVFEGSIPSRCSIRSVVFQSTRAPRM